MWSFCWLNFTQRGGLRGIFSKIVWYLDIKRDLRVEINGAYSGPRSKAYHLRHYFLKQRTGNNNKEMVKNIKKNLQHRLPFIHLKSC